jgi:hypothetical protein
MQAWGLVEERNWWTARLKHTAIAMKVTPIGKCVISIGVHFATSRSLASAAGVRALPAELASVADGAALCSSG